MRANGNVIFGEVFTGSDAGILRMRANGNKRRSNRVNIADAGILRMRANGNRVFRISRLLEMQASCG